MNIIHINQLEPDPYKRVSGDVNGNVIQWIRENSHRVLAKMTSDGVVTYCRLNDTDSNKYHDGTTATLTGNEGDVFVKLPTFYYKGTEGDEVDLHFAIEKPDDSYVEWNGDSILIGAYEAYTDGYFAFSRSGKQSTGNITQETCKLYSRNRGRGKWYQLVDWQMHCVLGCLYYAMYGNTDCQGTIGKGANSCTKNTGATDSLGMQDTKADTNGNTNSINFWGLENWWGNKDEWIDDYDNPANQLTATVNDPEKENGTRELGFTAISGYGVKKMKFGKYLDLCNTDSTYTNDQTTYYCDYQWFPRSTSTSSRVGQRSRSFSDTVGGVAFVYASYSLSSTHSHDGSRLAFRGKLVEEENVSTYKSLKDLSVYNHPVAT